jgi:inosine-uridine nucleoside N-ribohydrolase
MLAGATTFLTGQHHRGEPDDSARFLDFGAAIPAVIRAFLWAAALVVMSTLPASGREPAPVIVDDDWNIDTGGFVSEPYLPVLLESRSVRVVGLTMTSGDNWRDEGAVSLLRFLEMIGRPELPVYPGADKPLVQTYAFHEGWQARYRRYGWNGMWNASSVDKRSHPEDPWAIIPPVHGTPKIRPQREQAVDFIIRTVRAHPGEVTLYSGAPLTTIAAALRKDPGLPALVRRLVLPGSGITLATRSGAAEATFNLRMDPEAARIVLAAPWRSLVLLVVPGEQETLTQAQVDRIAARSPMIADYLVKAGNLGAPTFGGPSSLAYLADPSLAKRTGRRAVAVSDAHDESYGKLSVRASCAPPLPKAMRCATVVEIDADRAWTRWLEAISTLQREPDRLGAVP